jgi:Holliday junction resolvase RusA-like endonuclease
LNKFIVPGEPVGKGRPKMTVIPKSTTDKIQSNHISADDFKKINKAGKTYGVRTYTPAKTSTYEELVKYSFLSQIKYFAPLDGYIRMNITAIFGIPKSTTKKDKAKMLSGLILPAKIPDIDNITKSILDGLNKVLYKDDKQVIELSVKKKYGEEPCVIVEYETINPDND